MRKTSREDVSTVVEGMVAVGRHRRRGTFLIALGLIAAAGAVALVVGGKKQADSSEPAEVELPPVERRDALAAEQAGLDRPGSGDAGSGAAGADDAVGAVERKIDNALTGKPALPEQPRDTRRGRHAAQE